MDHIEIITHYPENDPEMVGDYSSVTILFNDEPILTYGDGYHDKGLEKAQGIVDLYEVLDYDVIITHTEVADDDPV